MKLEPEGKKRLESMKKTLAAGLPLVASVAVGAAAQGCIERHTMGKFPSEPQPEEWVLDGDIAPPELPPNVPSVPAVPEAPSEELSTTESPP